MGGKKGTITGEKGKSGDKKKPISRSARAGLQFPVGRIHRLLKVSLRLGLVQPYTAVTCFGGRERACCQSCRSRTTTATSRRCASLQPPLSTPTGSFCAAGQPWSDHGPDSPSVLEMIVTWM